MIPGHVFAIRRRGKDAGAHGSRSALIPYLPPKRCPTQSAEERVYPCGMQGPELVSAGFRLNGDVSIEPREVRQHLDVSCRERLPRHVDDIAALAGVDLQADCATRDEDSRRIVQGAGG